MPNDNNNNRGYNPEHERTCRGCYKVLKTKEGVLEGKYTFSCSGCHKWYKNAKYCVWGAGIGLVLLIFVIWIISEIRKKKEDD